MDSVAALYHTMWVAMVRLPTKPAYWPSPPHACATASPISFAELLIDEGFHVQIDALCDARGLVGHNDDAGFAGLGDGRGQGLRIVGHHADGVYTLGNQILYQGNLQGSIAALREEYVAVQAGIRSQLSYAYIYVVEPGVALLHEHDDSVPFSSTIWEPIISVLQHNVGHATAAFKLDVYGHVSQRMQKESANRMQSFFEGLQGCK